MDRLFFAIGGLSAFLGVALGAFAAHALNGRMDADLLATFEVGVRYQMYHALALLAVGWAHTRWQGAFLKTSGWLFVLGTVLFSGSLYVLSLSGERWLSTHPLAYPPFRQARVALFRWVPMNAYAKPLTGSHASMLRIPRTLANWLAKPHSRI